MQNWKAKTESGATYHYEDGIVNVQKSTVPGWGDTAIKGLTMKSAKVESDDNLGVPWKAPDMWEDVTVPIVGRRFYVASVGEWRVSTPIVSVELL